MKKTIRAFKLMAAIACSIAGLASIEAAAAPRRVAVIGTQPTFDSDVVTKLTATGNFAAVTYINGAATTPTLATLPTFDAVLAYTDSTFANPTALGNSLDTYLRGGGGVVLAMFAVSNGSTYGLTGSNFVNDFAIDPSGSQANFNGLTLGTINQPNNPLVAGLTSFNNGTSGYYNASATLVAGAVDIADYANGVPLIAERTINGYQTVNLNFYPPSSDARGDFWKSSTQGTLILSNALQVAGAQVAAVPEPATWAMMLVGFGAVGFGMRRRQKVTTRVAYTA